MMPFIEFPYTRPRRLRISKSLRDLVKETRFNVDQLVLPIFVNDGLDSPKPIESLLNNHYYYPPTSDELIKFIQDALNLGVKAFLLFGIPRRRDSIALEAYREDGVIQKALRFIRKELSYEPLVFTDLCICSYTDHGHCGLVSDRRGLRVVDNDSTLEIYKKIAVSHAEAGTDFVAPSGMMDGQVKAIREALDREGFHDVGIMSYSAKYSSCLYEPFRIAMDSSPRFGDRKSYQMDYRNSFEALKEVVMDIREGADIVMVKPALFYLDVIKMIKTYIPFYPLAAYSVSGEYVMLETMARHGYAKRENLLLEAITSIFRAGADIVITYHALDIAKIIRGA